MKNRVILLGLLGAIILVVAWAQSGRVRLQAGMASPEPNLPDKLVTSKEAVRWSLEPWTGDDEPYQTMRKEIDEKVAKGADIEQMRQLAWAQADKHSDDPKIQFQWAYCAWKTIAPDAPAAKAPASPFMKKLQTTHLMAYQLSRAPDPKTYNYTRLLYLGLPDDVYDLRAFGERLLRQEANDNDVKYHLVGDYASQISLIGFHTKQVDPALQHRALELAHELVEAAPKNTTYWATLGSVYYGATDINHSSGDAKKGIRAYQKYLELAPSKDEFYPQATHIINALRDKYVLSGN